MAWPLPPEDWWPCLVPNWKETIVVSIGAYPTPGNTLVSFIWDSIASAYLGGTGSEDEQRFRAVFQVIESTLPFPPPFDRSYLFTPALWDEMEAYLLTSPDTDIENCPPVRFKGNQGGAWPEIP